MLRNIDREVLVSLLVSAMVTSGFLPAAGPVNEAGAVDPVAARRVLESVLAGLPSDWKAPTTRVSIVAENVSAQVVPVSLDQKAALTSKRLHALIGLANGDTHADVPEWAAVPLQLTSSGPFVSRRLKHGRFPERQFSVGANDASKVLLVKLGATRTSPSYLYSCDPEGRLVKSGIVENGKFRLRDEKEALTDFNDEIDAWTEGDAVLTAPPSNA